MAWRFLRFVLPIAFAAAGWLFASFIVWVVVARIGVAAVTYDMIPALSGYIVQDVSTLLGIIPLIGIIVYLILGLPISAVILVGTKIIRGTAYDLDIAQIGNRFSGTRMIRRAATPAIFAVAISGIVMEFVEGILFRVLQNVPAEAVTLIQITYPVVGVLITTPIVLAIFIPTWILNDAGIVMHLRPEQLNIRRCPDTIGVGRWWSNLLAGFTLFTIPIVSFVQHFMPIISSGIIEPVPVFFAFVFSLGIPLIAMTFVMPVIVFNEILINPMKHAIRRIAKRMGARELKLETVLTETKIVDEEPEYNWAMSAGHDGTDSAN